MPKLQESMERFSLTIPRRIVDLKGWKKGQKLKFVERGGYVCLIEEE